MARKSHPGCAIGLVMDQDTQLQDPAQVQPEDLREDLRFSVGVSHQAAEQQPAWPGMVAEGAVGCTAQLVHGGSWQGAEERS